VVDDAAPGAVVEVSGGAVVVVTCMIPPGGSVDPVGDVDEDVEWSVVVLVVVDEDAGTVVEVSGGTEEPVVVVLSPVSDAAGLAA
jgi:hypothetical protein